MYSFVMDCLKTVKRYSQYLKSSYSLVFYDKIYWYDTINMCKY